MTTQQLDLFPDPDTLRITTYRHSDGSWHAYINDGWWSATGATAAEAAQRCVRNYEQETEMIR